MVWNGTAKFKVKLHRYPPIKNIDSSDRINQLLLVSNEGNATIVRETFELKKKIHINVRVVLILCFDLWKSRNAILIG
jgi:hypothetical protein